MAMIEEPDKAIRLARAIASDISLYNEEKIKEGIAQDTFFDALASEWKKGARCTKPAFPLTSTRKPNIFGRRS